MYEPGAVFRHEGAHSAGQLSFYDHQLIWYRNMRRGRLQTNAPGRHPCRASVSGGIGVVCVSKSEPKRSSHRLPEGSLATRHSAEQTSGSPEVSSYACADHERGNTKHRLNSWISCGEVSSAAKGWLFTS
jgi:hypothetical protein